MYIYIWSSQAEETSQHSQANAFTRERTNVKVSNRTVDICIYISSTVVESTVCLFFDVCTVWGCLVAGVKKFRVSHWMLYLMSEEVFGY
jgi:hypothetical protein